MSLLVYLGLWYVSLVCCVEAALGAGGWTPFCLSHINIPLDVAFHQPFLAPCFKRLSVEGVTIVYW